MRILSSSLAAVLVFCPLTCAYSQTKPESRYTQWCNLGGNVATAAIRLGYDSDTWNDLTGNAFEKLSYSTIASTKPEFAGDAINIGGSEVGYDL